MGNKKLMFFLAAAIMFVYSVAIPTVSESNTLLDFTYGNSTFGTAHMIDDGRITWASSWSQSVAASNLVISASVGRISDVTGSGTAYLMNAIGTGTDTASQIAVTTFSPSAWSWEIGSFTPVTLFSGIDLNPGTYYLVIEGPADGPYSNDYNWMGGPMSDTTVTLAPGFNLGGMYLANTLSGDTYNTYAPASGFRAWSSDSSNTEDTMGFFSITTRQPVPEPAGIMLFGLGLIGFAKIRRNI